MNRYSYRRSFNAAFQNQGNVLDRLRAVRDLQNKLVAQEARLLAEARRERIAWDQLGKHRSDEDAKLPSAGRGTPSSARLASLGTRLVSGLLMLLLVVSVACSDRQQEQRATIKPSAAAATPSKRPASSPASKTGSARTREPKMRVADGQTKGASVMAIGCLPDYATCLPAPPPKLKCIDIPEHDFKVLGDDPHGLDKDGDGIACER